MESVDDDLPPQVVGDVTQGPIHHRKIMFNRIVHKVIKTMVQLPNNPGTPITADNEKDGVFNYAQEVLTFSLLHAEFEDAIKEGDGLRVIRCWKFFSTNF
jgi:hypothetical protein